MLDLFRFKKMSRKTGLQILHLRVQQETDMLYQFKTIFIFTTLFLGTVQAQNNTNHISCEEYHAITFNGKTIEQINATEGDPQQLQQLFGSYSSVEQYEGVGSIRFNYGANGFTFNLRDNYLIGL
jgi:hypothetical protein